MVLVDSHCHLDMLTEYDSHDNIVKRALESNVNYIQTICTRLEDISKILAIAENYTKHPKVIGLGETGLDYYYNKDNSQQQLQRKSFEEHIKTSCESNLPVIVHTRAAEDDTYDIMNSYKKMHNFPGLIHCFTASEKFARKILDIGFYISIAGIITFKNAEELRAIVKFIPLDKLLLETDSPYLAPVPQRGKTNEPAYVKYVAQAISDLKGITVEKCAEQTTKNFFTLFSKASQVSIHNRYK